MNYFGKNKGTCHNQEEAKIFIANKPFFQKESFTKETNVFAKQK